MKSSLSVLCSLAIFSTTISSAQSHVVLAEPEAKSDSYYAGFFRIGHGCEGSPTILVRVEIPEDILTAKPQPKPGWTIEIEHEKIAKPVKSNYGDTTERVASITWRGNLLAEQFDQFGILFKVPNYVGTLYFPTIQMCETGSHHWTEIPKADERWHDLSHPAPVLTLTRKDH